MKVTLTIGQLRRLVMKSLWLDESKDRLIDKVPGLDGSQRAEMKKFFNTHHDLERNFDWNRLDSITYDSFHNLADKYPDSIDPDTVREFSNRRDEGDGIVTYEVENSEQALRAVRAVADTHWGKDFNGWCIIARKKTPEVPDELSLAHAAWMWFYSKLPKRIAFKNGKLLAFMATMKTDEQMRECFDKVLEKHPEYANEFSKYQFSVFRTHMTPDKDVKLFMLWLFKHHEDAYREVVRDEWWDRRNKPHPNLDWAR